jgi:diguanylate cyclase (GGDEF)-like protein
MEEKNNDLNSFFLPSDIPVRRFFLSFGPDIESDFRRYYFSRYIQQFRLALLLGFAVLALFWILDRFLAPSDYQLLWKIRFIFATPILLVTLGLSFAPFFSKIMQPMGLLSVIWVTAGIVWIISVSQPPLTYLYYASFILIFMFLFGFSRLRFPWALTTGVVMVLEYELSALLFSSSAPFILISNHFFLLSAILIGIFSCYYNEFSIRRAYYFNILLESEREKVDRINTILEQTVDKRTQQLVKANEELKRYAFLDTLTGLYNRRSFYSHSQEIILGASRQPNRKPMALLYIDLDFFKAANDSFGHDAGDDILTRVASRIKTCIRGSDFPCRMGGDEFTVLLTSVATDTDAGIVAEKILTTLSSPYQSSDYSISLSVSIGIALFPRDGTNLHTLIRAADNALHEAKKRRNTYTFYSSALHDKAAEKIDLIGKLRTAIELDQFQLYYQPILNREERVVAAEALLRWKDSEGTLVPTHKFMPVLEDTGIILPAGRWVLRQACIDAARWVHSGLHVVVSVNLSPKQLHDDKFLNFLQSTLRGTGLNPKRLHFEITESIFMENIENTLNRLGKIRELGVSFAVDDFGTGYSSYSYLKSLPIDTLKIDRSFISGLPDSEADRAIVASMVSMSQGLNLSSVAEGVENSRQLEALKKMGIEMFQGFYFCRPKPLEEFIEFASRFEARIFS